MKFRIRAKRLTPKGARDLPAYTSDRLELVVNRWNMQTPEPLLRGTIKDLRLMRYDPQTNRNILYPLVALRVSLVEEDAP